MSGETENSKTVDELIEKTDLNFMLEFETQIFLDILHKDGLVVAAKGINLDLVVTNLLKVYCDPGNLVIVLNANEHEEKSFRSKIQDDNVHTTTFTTNIEDRMDLYLSGGIHFVTTRILVVDMLKKRLPIEKITGFVVLRAHTIFESCQEAFVLRLFRQCNKTGFIKAFSNSAQSFTMGFCHVERVMRALFVKELYIWPRFHSMVIQSLKRREPSVIELHIPISENMKKIQTYILEIMNLTVKELKRINRTIELQEITVENCLTKKFHKILQSQLDVIWHQLSPKSRQFVADLKTLRHLMTAMLYTDPVSFYSMLLVYRTMEYAQVSTWVLSQPAEMLFTQAGSLVYTGEKELNPEFCPKWTTLLEILKVEIPTEIKKSKLTDSKILILCFDKGTCYQLRKLLCSGPHSYLYRTALKKKLQFKSINESFKKSLSPEDNQPTTSVKNAEDKLSSKKTKTTSSATDSTASGHDRYVGSSEKDDEEEEDFKSSYLLTMSQSLSISDLKEKDLAENQNAEEAEYLFESFAEMENMDLTQICEASLAPMIMIQTFKGANNFVNLQKTLEGLQPNFIIMYHMDMASVREIEMYEAHKQTNTPLKVFFMIHADTVEEQAYLTTLRREKEAFEFLIQTKSTMVVPDDQDGKSNQCLALQRDLKSPTKNTRQGGTVEETPNRRYIIVDMREFRSELPTLIHKRGIDIEPVTITVGDYILTPDICVERKSISDLIGSLNSGRLYQQCTQMSRYYSKPMLLIEFDQNKQFTWQSHYMVSQDSNNFDIQQKLLLLTLHFPKLKLIWSPSPYASAQLFEELKDGKEEPNIEYAGAIGGEDMDAIETKYNTNIYDFIQKLPGITSKNIDAFLRNMQSLDNTITKTENHKTDAVHGTLFQLVLEHINLLYKLKNLPDNLREDLKGVLGNSADAKSLFSILNEEHAPKENTEHIRQKTTTRWKRIAKGKTKSGV